MADIVLIHGAWLTPLSWEFFRQRYEAKGHRVIAPSWPFEDAPIEQLRARPDPRLNTLTIRQIVDHFDGIIRGLAAPPIIIGHSFGGLFAQLLLDRGLGVAGVALDPAPIRGVFPTPRMFVSSGPVLIAPFGWSRVLRMSFRSFSTSFAQTLPPNLMRPYYERYIIPTPGRIFWQAALGAQTGITRANPNRAPMLVAVGDRDRTVTPGNVATTFRRQKRSPALTEFRTFAGRSHFLFAEPGWEEVADTVLDWALANHR